MNQTRRLFVLAVCCMSLAAGGCMNKAPTHGQIPLEKTHPLPEVAATDQNFSAYKPANPYQEPGPNLLSRTVFEAPGPTGYRVEIRDIRVDAKRKAESVNFPGAAFLQVIEGAGTATIGSKRQELRSGDSLSIGESEQATLEATSDQPLTARVRLVRAE
jgi:quercetin dioxygenase-like cupin family protein